MSVVGKDRGRVKDNNTSFHESSGALRHSVVTVRVWSRLWLGRRRNLRVDDHPEPTQELGRLFNKMYPLKPYYKERPDNPAIGRVFDWAKARGIAL